jgi:1-deoxy-D-xylulose-5-phosphate synthase
MLYTAVNHPGPIAVRYPRGNGLGVALDAEYRALPIGRGEVLERGTDVLIVAFGPLVASAREVARRLHATLGVTTTVINARFAKPLDTELLAAELPRYPVVCTLEDHALAGGFGSAVLEFVNDSGITLKTAIKRFGVKDTFVPHGTQAEQHALHGYDVTGVYAYIAGQFSNYAARAAG